jgi:MFS transporter, ACS family, solute carrier family 17 (sodium-dependent inorganic phosphate cotransporter), other
MRIPPWPRRVDVALLCFLGNMIAHADRVSISVAAPALMREYGWDTAQTGWVLSGFFIGYTLLMIPVGFLTDRIGPKRVFAASMGWWSLFTLLTPLPRSVAGLAAVRVLLGAGESGTASCINGTLVRWFPPAEYSRATALCWSAGYAAPIVAFPLAALLLHQLGWRAIFYVFGLLGFLWLPLWLQTEEPNLELSRPARFPWRILLRSPVWAVFVLHFSSNWFLYVMITWLPSYLLNERHFSLPTMAAGAALPFLCAWIGVNGFAQAIDRLSPRVSRTAVRKAFLIPYAAAAAAVFLVPSASSPDATVVLLCLSMTLFTSATPIYSSGSLDLAPEFAGTLAGFQNAFANLAGIIAPVATGYLVRALGWYSAFWLTAAIVLAGVMPYLLVGRADRLTTD